ncbi:hypothetical protein D0Y65_055329 [Glycine soja]|uniref:Uncharacterized protein n=1 Tax=Glycine soja TaxID=3848 RepID=A0A445EY55_GLYSO|nr:hypothetical protein D0Y65_055329 [Glycine soja]
MLTGLFASFFVATRVNMFDVCASPVRILFMLLPIMVISTMLNYVKLEVHSGINLSRMQNLQFTRMKQVKELSLIEYVFVDDNSGDKLSSSYATGFASVDFIVWNLVNENKEEDYHLDACHLTVLSPPSGKYDLEIVTDICPQKNTSLEDGRHYAVWEDPFKNWLVTITFYLILSFEKSV